MTGKVAQIIVGVVIAIGSATLGWLGRGKKENKRHAKTQAIIIKLEERLRKVEKELSNSKYLAKDQIEKLMRERDNLKEKIERHMAA